MELKDPELNNREKTILRSVIYTFIQTAAPVGSRYISKRHSLGLSAATVRNVMSDLEDLGYIGHPHTSAGRVPTDKGYRFYVDSLIELEKLSRGEQNAIQSQLQTVTDPEDVLRETSKLIGTISHQLGVVSAPKLSSGSLDRIELVPLSSTRIMVIMSIQSGFVKTIMMEVQAEIPRQKLDDVARLLNERLSGLTLQHIRHTFPERMQDLRHEETGLIRLFVESVDKLFDDAPGHEKIHIGGTTSLLSQPEFEDSDKFRSIIDLLENEDIIVHVLEKADPRDGAIAIAIGTENSDEKLHDLSLIASPYTIGGTRGTVGVIGSKRMDYQKVIPIVEYVAKTISSLFA
ncbi:MAG: heat-inducible transcriptional repressor HrcA [Ignavibacteriales bacterium]|nr:heat-inducible transcriptional repressor HrcA [Ignavibacteriales bacterium]